MNFENNLPTEAVREIASILAKGFLRHWRAQHVRLVSDAAGQLDSSETPSPDGTVVNANETGETA